MFCSEVKEGQWVSLKCGNACGFSDLSHPMQKPHRNTEKERPKTKPATDESDGTQDSKNDHSKAAELYTI
jgi:hypothetical protein